jgi:hypothetical protein
LPLLLLSGAAIAAQGDIDITTDINNQTITTKPAQLSRDTTEVIIGVPTNGNYIPFWGSSYDAMRFQVLFLQSEINVLGDIVTFSWNPSTSTTGLFNNMRVYMCHTSATQLSATFDDNYTGNTPAEVINVPSMTVGGPAGIWYDWDVYFPYNNVDNLLVEVRWNGDGGLGIPMWRTTEAVERRLWAPDDNASTGTLQFTGNYVRLYLTPPSGGLVLWDFETGWQGWTKTGAYPFPNGWGVEWALHYASYACPAPGDSSMWFDDDAAGSSAPPLQDTALSPILIPNSNTQWLKWGVGYNYLGSPEFLEVGIKYFNGSTWSATALQTYTTDIMPGIWDSVDVSAYNTYDLVQIYFYYDDGGSWNWYGCFDNVSLNADIAQHDAGTTAILEPVGTHFLNDVVTPTATVKNHGDFDETFPVVFTITHNAALVFADTVSVTLSPGAVDTAVFASYTLAETGAYNSVCYTELVGDENPGNDTATAQANVYSGLIPYVIIDADVTPITGAWLDTKFQSWGLTGVYTTNPNVINADSLAIYQSVWICLGIYANNYALTTDQATAIGTYLATGRNVYLEGGDCWGFDASRTILCPLFGIDPNATVDGSADLFTVQGQANAQIPQVSGNNWNYTGENNWIDRLGIYASPPNGGTVAGFLWNPSVSYWTGAAYDQGTWKTVGLSHELAGDVAGTVPGDSLLMWIAQYLELQVGIQEQPVGHDVQAFGFAPRMSTIANGHVPITYTTTVSGPVSLQVYDGAGRLVQTLVNTQQPAGEKSFVWNRTDINGRKVANGVYFFRLQAENKTATHKFVLVD